jgi:2-polyprenyl-3-methyl-5-hydroxy-6-metoxy-1,4-benzoquinol methylase
MRKQNNTCPICHKNVMDSMHGLSEYWYCSYCALGRIKEIPKTSYREDYYVSGSSLLSKVFTPIGRTFFMIRNGYVGLDKKKIWIDVGAGEGAYVETVNADKKIGVEISQSGRKVMKKKGVTVLSNDEFLKTKNIHADVISFWHVLEHVDTPEKYIQAAVRNLADKGKVIIAVPNIDCLEFRFFRRSWFHLAPQYHVWFFSPQSLEKMVTKYGLTIEKKDYWAIEHHLTGLLQSFINYTTHTDNTLHKLIRRKQDLHRIKPSHMLWIIFWCTLGLPIVLLVWIISTLLGKPGTFVMVAVKCAV